MESKLNRKAERRIMIMVMVMVMIRLVLGLE